MANNFYFFLRRAYVLCDQHFFSWIAICNLSYVRPETSGLTLSFQVIHFSKCLMQNHII